MLLQKALFFHLKLRIIVYYLSYELHYSTRNKNYHTDLKNCRSKKCGSHRTFSLEQIFKLLSDTFLLGFQRAVAAGGGSTAIKQKAHERLERISETPAHLFATIHTQKATEAP